MKELTEDQVPAESQAAPKEQSGPYNPFTLAAKRLTRTSMLSGLAVTSALLGAACSGAITPAVFASGAAGSDGDADALTDGGKYSDTDIVNFALNLEYLEAEFYNVAVNGKTIEELGVKTNGVGKHGPTKGGKQVSISNKTEDGVAKEIASDELTHVELLRTLLGNKAIAKPTINLDALGIGFKNSMQFLVLARAFEDTGVSAYGGAAPLITSKEVLSYAARILAVEAFHTGSIRTMIAAMNIPTNPPGKLDGKDRLPPPSGTQYFDTIKALSVTRTFAEVVAIVKPFFPDGINGVIQ